MGVKYYLMIIYPRDYRKGDRGNVWFIMSPNKKEEFTEDTKYPYLSLEFV